MSSSIPELPEAVNPAAAVRSSTTARRRGGLGKNKSQKFFLKFIIKSHNHCGLLSGCPKIQSLFFIFVGNSLFSPNKVFENVVVK